MSNPGRNNAKIANQKAWDGGGSARTTKASLINYVKTHANVPPKRRNLIFKINVLSGGVGRMATKGNRCTLSASGCDGYIK